MSCSLDKYNNIPRIELAKEALLTMIENLKNGNQILISVSDDESNLIIPLSPKGGEEKINNIQIGE